MHPQAEQIPAPSRTLSPEIQAVKCKGTGAVPKRSTTQTAESLDGKCNKQHQTTPLQISEVPISEVVVLLQWSGIQCNNNNSWNVSGVAQTLLWKIAKSKLKAAMNNLKTLLEGFLNLSPPPPPPALIEVLVLTNPKPQFRNPLRKKAQDLQGHGFLATEQFHGGLLFGYFFDARTRENARQDLKSRRWVWGVWDVFKGYHYYCYYY